ncbi:MAG: DUF5131 family protein, partial [Hyphomicrobium sp.]
AVAHEPHLFHHCPSLFYQYAFYGRQRRWPTWADASAHCEPLIVDALKDVLAANKMKWSEPLLGPIDLTTPEGWLWRHGGRLREPVRGWPEHPRRSGGIDWVIVGGESQAGARPMHPDWARALRDQCAAAGVTFFFKQWGEWRQPSEGETFNTSKGRAQRLPAFLVGPDGNVHCFHGDHTVGAATMLRVGKKRAGRLLDGVEHNGMPGASTPAQRLPEPAEAV